MPSPRILNQLLPLVAIGTVADCQSILDTTNRALVRGGISVIQKNNYQLPGLQELMDQTGLQAKINQGYNLTSQDLGFTLSPILNSSGRLNHARLSIAGLSNSLSFADKMSELRQAHLNDLISRLIQTNTSRKQAVKDIFESIEKGAKEQISNGQNMIWLEGEWSKGLVGLLASRLVNQYNCPVVVVSKHSQVFDKELILAQAKSAFGN